MPQARTEVGDITLITSITCVKFVAHPAKNSAKIDSQKVPHIYS